MTAPALDLDGYLATFIDPPEPDDHEWSMTGTGQWIRHHKVDDCGGDPCCIHQPSAHSMIMWPLHFRADRAPLMERLCPVHGTGHPDPDSIRWLEKIMPNGAWSVHGCCGCCRGRRDEPS